MIRPTLTLLDGALIQRAVNEAYQLLEEPGVQVHSDRALELLDGVGARIDKAARVARIPSDVVQRCLETVPHSFRLYDADGEPGALRYGL